MDSVIYKICSAKLWSDALGQGVFAGAPVDLADGYIHFSTASQVSETAAKHFSGQRDLLLLAIRADAIGNELKYEVSRGGALFPHLYAPLPLSAVIWAKPLSHDQNGDPVIPELVP